MAEYKDGNFKYSNAGKNAPPGVKTSINMFHKLPVDDKKELPLLYYILGSGTPDYKMSKVDSDYTNKSTGEQNCGNCEFAYKKVKTGKYICSQISGKIELGGWCRLWE